MIIGDLNAARGEALAASLRASTGNPQYAPFPFPSSSQSLTPSRSLHFLPVDVTSYPSQLTFFRRALSLAPSHTLHTIIANAGVGELGDFATPPPLPAHLDPPEPDLSTLDINLKGAIFTTRLALHHLSTTPAASDRCIILIGSIASFASGPAMALYCTSKHALLGLFRSLRLYPSRNACVRLNMVCPYFVDTPILPIAAKALLAGLELARLDDVVESVARLVCDEAVAGRCLMVAPRGSGGIVEVGVDEMEQVEVFSRRVVRALNLEARTRARGWIGTFWDLLVLLLLGPIVRLFAK